MQSLKNRFVIQFILIILVFVVTFVVAGFLGSADLKSGDVFNILKHKLLGEALEGVSRGSLSIVWDLRIPRALLAIAVGGGLAISGAGMQACTQNVLAEPYMLGVSSGALTGVTALYYFLPNNPYTGIMAPIAAFIGAMLAHVTVYKIADVGRSSNSKLILAGMSVNVVLGALSNYFIISSGDVNATRSIISWMMGSLAAARWNNILLPIILITFVALFFLFRARDFDLISLGDGNALALGVNAGQLKKQAVVAVSVIAAMCVASAGLIGLVGFLVPHSIRMLIGSEHRKLFPITFVGGAVFLMWMDILSRTLIAPRELPVGIFTALVGGPFFLWILVRGKGA